MLHTLRLQDGYTGYSVKVKEDVIPLASFLKFGLHFPKVVEFILTTDHKFETDFVFSIKVNQENN